MEEFFFDIGIALLGSKAWGITVIHAAAIATRLGAAGLPCAQWKVGRAPWRLQFLQAGINFLSDDVIPIEKKAPNGCHPGFPHIGCGLIRGVFRGVSQKIRKPLGKKE